MECRSREWHSRKLYYLDVTYLNINKAFPYQKKNLMTGPAPKPSQPST
jgi:hypothetical protein